MASSIEQLLQLDKAHHLFPPSTADDGSWKQAGDCLHNFPHLQTKGDEPLAMLTSLADRTCGVCEALAASISFKLADSRKHGNQMVYEGALVYR